MSSTALFIAACNYDLGWLGAVNATSPLEVHVAGCDSPGVWAAGCHDEAYHYLHFIVTRYDDLPERTLFVHGHRHTSHYPCPLDRTIPLLLGHTAYLASAQFGGLYCQANAQSAALGWCRDKHSDPSECTETQLWDRMYANTGVAQPRAPEDYFSPCCGTFFATREAVRQRPRHVYKQILHNMKHNFHDEFRDKRTCGRILESSWHVLFLPPNTTYQPPPYCNSDYPTNRLGPSPLELCSNEYVAEQVIGYGAFYGVALLPMLVAVCVLARARSERSPGVASLA